MAELAPPATMKTPVRAGLRARPGPASQELFAKKSQDSPVLTALYNVSVSDSQSGCH